MLFHASVTDDRNIGSKPADFGRVNSDAIRHSATAWLYLRIFVQANSWKLKRPDSLFPPWRGGGGDLFPRVEK